MDFAFPELENCHSRCCRSKACGIFLVNNYIVLKYTPCLKVWPKYQAQILNMYSEKDHSIEKELLDFWWVDPS